jgi:hypothetical protein
MHIVVDANGESDTKRLRLPLHHFRRQLEQHTDVHVLALKRNGFDSLGCHPGPVFED